MELLVVAITVAFLVISEALIEQEKSAEFSPEAPQTSIEDEATEVVLKVGEKELSASSAEEVNPEVKEHKLQCGSAAEIKNLNFKKKNF